LSTARLIINADDFGWTYGITDGILRAHEEGVVTSTSLLVNQPASEYAIEQARQTPRMGVGIHLNLCSGAPVLPASQVPSLVGHDGNFHPAPEMARRLLRWRVSGREILAEFRAQIRWARARGVEPTHADSHYHVHLYPAAVNAFRRAVMAEGVRRIRTPRHTVAPANGILPQCHGGPAYRRFALLAYMQVLQRAAFRRLSMPDFCLVARPEYRNDVARLREGWRSTFANVGSGSFEFCCHPGLRDRGFPQADYLRDRRELELDILIDPELKRIAEQQHIQLINYSDL